MKRTILFLLSVLGFTLTSCEPKEDEIIPVPEYGVPYSTFHTVESADNLLND